MPALAAAQFMSIGPAPREGLILRQGRRKGGTNETRLTETDAEVCVKETGLRNSAHGADKFGFKDLAAVRWSLTAEPLYEHALSKGEATIVQGGALCAETGITTGRSPKDKFVVSDAHSEKT